MSAMRWAVLCATMLVAMLSTAGPALGQAQPRDPIIIVPQLPPIWPTEIWPAPDRGVSLTSVEVSAEIDGRVSATTVRLTLTNPSGRAQEAQVLMPVPDGAVVRQFMLEGMGEKGIAEILERDEARRIYESIVAKVRDPGLLEFVGQGLMRSSVFPVPAGGTQVVSLTYEQILPADGDRVDWVLPRSGSMDAGGVTWSVSVTISAPRPISTVYSPTNDLSIERLGPSRVRVSVPSSKIAGGNVAISYLMDAGEGLTATLVAYPDPEHPGGGYFLLLAGLPPVAPEDVEPVEREVTLVIDRSGSMRGEKIEQAREAAIQVLEGLADGESFNIIDYSDTVESFADGPVVKGEETMAKARAYLAGLAATGGTNIHDALLEALRPEPREGVLPMVLFLTDGLPTVGVRSESEIREAVATANAHERRIFTFGVGNDVNAPLLTNIATASRAATTFVLPDEDVEVKVGQVFRRLSGPVLARPELAAMNFDVSVSSPRIREVMPQALPDLFEGDQLVVLGRYTPGSNQLQLRLTGEYFGEERVFEFIFDTDKATARNGYVPRLWASRKIGTLINEIRQAGANGHMPGEEPALSDAQMKELVDEIVRLSIRWGILTEYTAFLATPEEDVVRDLAFRFGDQLGAAPAPEAMNRAIAGDALMQSQRERAGEEAVRQEQSLQTYYLNTTNTAQGKIGYAAAEGRAAGVAGASASNVRTVADQTFFNRAGRWVQAELVEVEKPEIDERVEYGTGAYDELMDALIAEGRGAVLAMRGEILLKRGGRTVLVVWPGE